jgi:hypothetical protein
MEKGAVVLFLLLLEWLVDWTDTAYCGVILLSRLQ